MAEGVQLVQILPTLVGIFGLVVGLYVWSKHPYLPPSRAFLMVMLFFFAYGPVYYVFSSAPSEELAQIFGRISMFIVVLAFAYIVFLASYLPYERFAGWFRRSRREYALISVLGAFIASYGPMTVTQYDDGWGFEITTGFVVWMIVMVGFALGGIYMFTKTCLSTKNKTIRRQATLLSLGIAAPYLYSVIVSALLVAGYDVPNTYSPGIVFLILIFAYAVLRYRAFGGEERGRETVFHTEAGRAEELKGRLIIIEDKKSEVALGLFNGLVSSGTTGLLVTRMVPEGSEEVAAGARILTLSSQVGENRLDPANLSILHHTIREFLKKNPNSVAMIDGIEYLIENNSAGKVVMFVQSLRDDVIMVGASLILSMDPETIEPRFLSMFEREFEVLGPGRGAGTEI